MKDYYEVLNVPKNINNDQLKKKYRELVMKFHPDLHPQNTLEAEAKFKEIQVAYQIISDPQKRQQYDKAMFGHSETILHVNFDGQNVEEIVEAIVRNLSPSTTAEPIPSKIRTKTGEDIRTRLEVTQEIIHNGGHATISLQKDVVCPDCDGSGISKQGKKKLCSFCDGSGEIKEMSGRMVCCPRCSGHGYLIDIPCNTCHSVGKISKLCTWDVQVPMDGKDGQQIQLVGEGNPGQNGGPSGNLHIELYWLDTVNFRRDGLNCISEFTINIKKAILGTTIMVKTLRGIVPLILAPGIQPETAFRLSGYGDTINGQTGDHLVVIHVHIPEKITPKCRQLLDEITDEL